MAHSNGTLKVAGLVATGALAAQLAAIIVGPGPDPPVARATPSPSVAVSAAPSPLPTSRPTLVPATESPGPTPPSMAPSPPGTPPPTLVALETPTLEPAPSISAPGAPTPAATATEAPSAAPASSAAPCETHGRHVGWEAKGRECPGKPAHAGKPDAALVLVPIIGGIVMLTRRTRCPSSRAG